MKRRWTKQEDKLLRGHYRATPIGIISKKLRRTRTAIYGRVNLLGIHRPPDFVEAQNKELGRRAMRHPAMIRNRYRKGVRLKHQFKPPKGYHAPGAEKGWFPKGHKPFNTKHDGAISIRWEKTGHTGRKRPVKMIRIAENKWEYLHVHLWKKHKGKVPRGYRVMFKDRNSMNVRLSNLVLMSAKEAGRLMALYDETIAARLSILPGRRGVYDKEKAAHILRHRPDLIRVKRKQILLQQKLRGK